MGMVFRGCWRGVRVKLRKRRNGASGVQFSGAPSTAQVLCFPQYVAGGEKLEQRKVFFKANHSVKKNPF